MKGFFACLWAESLKVRKSKMFLGTILVFSFVAVMLGLLMFVAQHPEIAGRSATVSAKASVVGKGDWPSFFGLLIQCILSLGAMAFGIVTSWIFGREYSDRVVKDLLALPVSRFTIVTSKFFILFIWNVLLSLTLFMVAFITGLAVHIPGWSAEIVTPSIVVFTKSAILTILLCTPVALIASIGRGYLLPIGYVILTLIITQLVGVGMPGIAPYFPWAVPALCSGVAGQAAPPPCAAGYVIFGFTIIAGFLGTAAWWRFADQT
jgi:ABC-2 type transport system permease protein